MAAELAGTAAIRLVPSLTGFRARAQTELQRQKGLSVDVDIRPKVDTSTAKRQLERFRAKEQADAINLKARIDEADFKRQFQRVEHVFERSAFAKAFRLQIKVIGADALYSLIGVAGSAAAALDTVAKSAAIIPGALASAGVAAGVFALALGDVKKAITAMHTEQDQAADKARSFASAQRDSADAAKDVERAQSGVASAVRQSIRTYEDLAHAVRGTSLDEADALLNVQESYDKLAQGGQKSLTELRRDQLAYARDLHNLDGVRIQSKRTIEDYNDAQRTGVNGMPQVVAALDAVAQAQGRVADAASRMADASQTKTDVGAFARLSPSAKEFATAITDAQGAWVNFTSRLQEGVFRGQATNMIDTLNTSVANLGPNLDRVASQIGGVFTDLGAIIRRSDIQGFLTGITGNTANTLSTLRRGLDPLITGFLRMADVGSRHLPQLADLFNRLFERFNAWTERISADGTLDKWITDGIAGLQSLINTTQNIVLIIGDVATAWRRAGGQQSGMISDAEHLTEVIHQWTSGDGMATLVEQFRNVRDWTGRMVDAIQNIWPTVVQIAQTAREWSVTFFTILGYMLRMTAWVQEHTGLVKFLVAAYLSIRTVKPVWDLLTNAAKAYTNVMMRASTLGGPAGAFAQNSVSGLATVQTAMGKTNTSAQQMAATFTTSQDKTQSALKKTSSLAATTSQGPLTRLQQSFMNMITPVNSTAGQINRLNGFLPDTSTKVTNLGTAANQTAGKVGGGAAGGAGGLFGAVKGLAGFIGPGLAFAVAVGAAVWIIDKMGEAHRKAAAEAENQKNQLMALKSTLDSFTGAFTPQTAIDTAKTAQGFDIPGLGKRNIQQDLASTGLPFTQQQLISATNPVNTQLRDQMLAALEAQTRGRVEASKVWDQHGYWLRDNGFDINMLVRAMSGDPAMIAKFNAIPKEPDGQGGYLPQTTLTDFATGAGTPGSLTTSIFLRDTSGGYGATGTQNQQASAAAYGTGTLKPGVQGYGPNPRVTMNSPDTAIVETSGPIDEEYIKNFPSDVGTVVRLPDGRGQITLTRAGTARDIEHHAEGGMIRGVGSGMSDSNLIMASRGEYIVRKAAVDALGVQNLDRMNSMRFRGFNVGGLPFPMAPPAPPPIIPPPPITPTVTPEPYQPTIDPAAAAPPPPVPEPPVLPPTPTPTVPMTTSMPYSPYAGAGQPSYSMTQLPPNMGPGPFGPIPVQTDNMDDTIASYLTGLARQNGLRVGALSSDPEFNAKFGAGTHDNDGGWHPNHRALDIGNGPDSLGLAQWWIQDPARVASTKELILNVPGWDTGMNIKDGKFVRDYGGGVYDQATLNGHGDHMHLAIGTVPNSQGGIMVNGQPVSYDAYQPTIGASGYPGLPGTGTGTDSNLPLGDRIAKIYENAFKPENLNKFIFGQIENVGQSLLGIGLSFIKGFTGIDLGQLTGIGQQVMQHFTGTDSSGSGSDSTLQSGSAMDNAISGNISSFFDPMAGVQLPGMPGGQHGTGGAGPGPGANKGEIAKYIYQAGVQAGLSPDEAVALVAYAIGESGLDPGISGGAQTVPGSPGGEADTVLGLFQEKPGFAQAGGVDPSMRGTVQGNVQAYINNLMKHRGQGDILDQLLATSQGGPMHTGGRGAMEGLIGQAKSILGFAGGGFVPARVSRGEYRMSPKAVAHYGLGFMNRVNSFGGGGFAQGVVMPRLPIPGPSTKMHPSGGPGDFIGPKVPFGPDLPVGPAYPFPHGKLPGIGGGASRSAYQMLGGFAYGGMPSGVVLPRIPLPPLPRPPDANQMAPRPAQPAPPAPRPVMPPGGQVQQQAPAPAPVAPSAGPPTGSQGAPSAGEVPDFTPFIPGIPTGQQPKPAGMAPVDSRSQYQGPAPASNNHNIGWLDQAIKEGANHAGQLGAMAASMGMMMAGGGGGGGAGMLIQGMAKMGGQAVASAVNVLSSAGVGTIMGIGTKATPSGAPLLPTTPTVGFGQLPGQDQMNKPMPQQQQGGSGPLIMNVYNGGIHTQNMDEWQRRQQLLERQQEQPLTNSFVH
jgi:hypothetical protein